MPELPEVETVRRALEGELVGRRIERVAIGRLPLREPLDRRALGARLPKRSFVGFRRRAKYLLVDLDGDGGTLLVHLGMSGRLLLGPTAGEVAPHTHVRLALDDGRELRLVDPRRFGLFRRLAPGAEADDPSLRILGLEPLEAGLEEALPRLFAGRRAPVKALLLDQRLVAGVGNIYADESLFRAAIRPTRAAGEVSALRLRRLGAAVREVLSEAVAQGGTTIRDYARPNGWPGGFAVRLAVYGRGGEACPRCGTKLREGVVAGRGTTWCGRCQR